MTTTNVKLPDVDIDGAVVELHRDADGTVSADVRIPASSAVTLQDAPRTEASR